MKIIITRHGETEENREGIFMGQLHGKLTEKGINQAKKLGLRLKDEKIDKIFSSDLARSFDTAKEILKYHQDVPVEKTEKLRERFLGEFEGVKKEDLGLDRNKLIMGDIDPKKGEPFEDMFNRARNFINEVVEKFNDETVLLVAHNGINQALIVNILSGELEDFLKAGSQFNCAVNMFEVDKDKNTKTILLNCGEHLGDLK